MSATPSGALAPWSSSAQAVDDFLEVVLADRDLLTAEFEAIVEEAWGGDGPESDPSARRSVERWSASPPVDDPGRTPVPATPRSPRARVRSPPRSAQRRGGAAVDHSDGRPEATPA